MSLLTFDLLFVRLVAAENLADWTPAAKPWIYE
jgi:hypothetical protein